MHVVIIILLQVGIFLIVTIILIVCYQNIVSKLQAIEHFIQQIKIRGQKLAMSHFISVY